MNTKSFTVLFSRAAILAAAILPGRCGSVGGGSRAGVHGATKRR